MDETTELMPDFPRDADKCLSAHTIRKHAKAIDAAHALLRDYDRAIGIIQGDIKDHATRIERLESETRDVKLMVAGVSADIARIQAGQKGMLSSMDQIASIASATHSAVITHITEEVIANEKNTSSELKRYQSTTQLIVKLTGYIAAMLAILYVIYQAIQGKLPFGI